jgi:excisionase family DNA binding protein
MQRMEQHQDGRDAERNRRRPEGGEPDSSAPGLLRTSDVAALFQVSSRTVSEWARQGRVPCMRTPGGQWRYPALPIRQLLIRLEHMDWDGDRDLNLEDR